MLSTVPSSKQHRQSYGRTRNGCYSCKRRRKKCDEAKPICVACMRNRLQCDWPEQSLTENSNLNGSASRTRSRSIQSNSTRASESDIEADLDDIHSEMIESMSPHRNKSEILEVSLFSPSPSPSDVWQNSLNSGMSFQRVLNQTSSSHLLFTHYLEKTSALLSIRPCHQNLFVTHVVPVAICNDTLMHALLALSGAHLDFRNRAAPEVQQAISDHYVWALKNLRFELQNRSSQPASRTVELLLVLVILCHFEVRKKIQDDF